MSPLDHEGGWKHGRARLALAALSCVLPMPLKRLMWTRIFGWDIDPSATVGLSLFLGVEHVRLGRGVRIGSFNVVRNLRVFNVGEAGQLGQWNWVTASAAFSDDTPGAGSLELGPHSSIVSRHYVDCSGGVVIGEFTTIAGVRSVILSHEISVADARQTLRPVRIGDYCLLSTNVCVVPGASIASSCQVAAGAVVVGDLGRPHSLYGGVPARLFREVEGAYFDRDTGFIAP